MRASLYLSLSLALALGTAAFGCGGDDDPPPDTDGGGGGDEDGGGGGDDDGGGGGDDDGGGGGDDDGGGGSDDGGGGDTDGGGGSAAAAWCADYEETCSFGGAMRFDDADECIAYYDDAPEACVTCIEDHLAFAMESEPGTHCPHATGEGPCNEPCP